MRIVFLVIARIKRMKKKILVNLEIKKSEIKERFPFCRER